MRDPSPLSKRFRLTYPRRRNWPENWKFWLSLLLVLIVGGYVAALSIRGDQRIYSTGEISEVHHFIADDCRQCHQPDPQRSGYWLAVQDSACLKCHNAGAHHPLGAMHPSMTTGVSDRLGAVSMSTNCVQCHSEHRGRDYNISRVDDSVCVSCHGDLAAHRPSAPPPTSGDGGQP